MARYAPTLNRPCDLLCPSCRREPKPGARFCGACGSVLDEPLPEPEPPREEPSRAVVRPPDHHELWHHLKCAVGLFLILMCTHLVVILIGRFGDPGIDLDVIVTVVDAAIILAFAGLGLDDLRPLLAGNGLRPRNLALVLGGFAFMLAFMTVYFLVLHEALGLQTDRVSTPYLASGTSVPTMLLLIAVCPAVFEELAFRGVIMERLRRVMNPTETLLLQAALFSVLHLSPTIFVSHFVMGLVFGWIRVTSRSLYPAMLLHALWNASILLRELQL